MCHAVDCFQVFTFSLTAWDIYVTQVFKHRMCKGVIHHILKSPGDLVLLNCVSGWHRTAAVSMLLWAMLSATWWMLVLSWLIKTSQFNVCIYLLLTWTWPRGYWFWKVKVLRRWVSMLLCSCHPFLGHGSSRQKWPWRSRTSPWTSFLAFNKKWNRACQCQSSPIHDKRQRCQGACDPKQYLPGMEAQFDMIAKPRFRFRGMLFVFSWSFHSWSHSLLWHWAKHVMCCSMLWHEH